MGFHVKLQCLQSDPFIFTFVLKPVPSALALAREVTEAALESWGAPEDNIDSAKLVTSELVTNAMEASPDDALVTMRIFQTDAGTPMIEVWDESNAPPNPQNPEWQAEGGRGLQVVEALSLRWGHNQLSTGGKVVWCELPCTG